ncbi:MAG: protein MalT [Desulfobacterales bacterium]|nr:protein MalT [Desulfobacterales bacterium]
MIPGGSHIPETPDVLPRPRLYNILSQYERCRVVPVTGQAAQGKSTLVASFLKQRPELSIWFHLDPTASDHGVLFDLLIRELPDDSQGNTERGNTAAPPHIPLGGRQDLLRQIDIVVQILTLYGKPLNIVFDDMEVLGERGSALDLIEGLINDSPPFVRFFLISRTRPPINLSRFKISRQVLTLTNTDLAFTLDEAMAFFTEKPWLTDGGDVPGKETVGKILKATEGWAGGLVLVSESLRRAGNLNHLPDHLTAEAFSYFSSEIYRSLTPDIRDLLKKTAIFDELDTKVLTLFFETADPRAMLAELERRNLFIRRVRHDAGGPVYRYNALFREFLTADLRETAGSRGIRKLNEQAGDIYWELKDHEKAIGHFMAAGCYEQIARIIRIKGADYVITGRAHRLAEWIDALPEQMTAEDPWLIFFATMALRIKGGKNNIRAFAGALELFREQSDARGILLCTAYLIEASVFIRQPSRIILKWIRAGEQALEDLKGQHRFTWARALLWQQIGLGYIAGNGDIPKGMSACRNAVILARHIDNPDLQLNASIIQILGLVHAGDLSGARAMLEKTRTMTTQYPEYRALKNITNADFALKRGDMVLADELLSKSEADIDKFGLIFLYPGTVETRAVYHIQTGQYDQAVQAADHLSDFSILEGNDFYLGISHRIKAIAALCRGQFDRAVDAAKNAIRELDQSRRGDIHLSLARQVLGLALYRAERYDAARDELKAVLQYFKSIGADLAGSETAICLGVLAHDTGDASGGARVLETGVSRAMENNYHYFPLLDHGTLARGLVLACSKQVVPEDKLAVFLDGFVAPEILELTAREIETFLSGLPKKKQGEAADRLSKLFRATRPRVMINTLGPFSVTLGTKALPVSVFGGAKPLQLLKAIVLKGGTDVPKEVLIDALWPDTAAAAGEKNLKVNLYRLRKALEPSHSKAFGYVYLSQKAGRISLDPGLVRTDTRLFSALVDDGNAREQKGRLSEALDVYDKALTLYRGDYFAEDPYLEWMGNTREFFRRKCISVLVKKAAIHEELDQWQAAVEAWEAVLRLDACNEPAYQNLMILYADAGMQTEAVSVFDRCRETLKQDLDAVPARDTLAIYERITLK